MENLKEDKGYGIDLIEDASDDIYSTFQNTESKSAPWNLSGIPAEESLGPSNVTNSSKPTWPSPDETERNTNMSLYTVTQELDYLQQSLCPFELTNKEREWEEHTIYIKSLDDNLQLHLIGHIAQWTHGHPQLLLWDEAIPISIKYFECLTNFCRKKEGSNYVKSREEGCSYFLQMQLWTTAHRSEDWKR